MVLTEKEQTTIEDLRTQEQSCIEKYKRYGQEAKDPILRDLFDELQREEEKHYNSLGQVLTGKVPSCNCNDRDGAQYHRLYWDRKNGFRRVQHESIQLWGQRSTQAACRYPD